MSRYRSITCRESEPAPETAKSISASGVSPTQLTDVQPEHKSNERVTGMKFLMCGSVLSMNMELTSKILIGETSAMSLDTGITSIVKEAMAKNDGQRRTKITKKVS